MRPLSDLQAHQRPEGADDSVDMNLQVDGECEGGQLDRNPDAPVRNQIGRDESGIESFWPGPANGCERTISRKPEMENRIYRCDEHNRPHKLIDGGLQKQCQHVMSLAEKPVQQMKAPVPDDTQRTIPEHLQHNDATDMTRTQRRHEDQEQARNNATEKNSIEKRRNPSARDKPTRKRRQNLRNRCAAIIRRNEYRGNRPENDSRQ